MFLLKGTAVFLILSVLLRLSLFPHEAKAAPLEREPAFRDNFYSVEIRGNLCWIVGYYGTILHSRDRGLSWEIQDSKTREALFRVVFVNDKEGWASGSYGTILHTRNGGQSWEVQSTSTREHLFGLYFADEHRGWAVGSRGTILLTVDGGASWISRSVGDDVILNDVRFKDRRQGWAVGEFGRIYHSRDGGRTWLKQPSPIEVSFVSGESRNLFRLLFPDSGAGWAFGLDGVILKTRNGARWEVHSPDGTGPRRAPRHHLFSAASYNGRKWAVGERGTVLSASAGQDEWKATKVKIPPVPLNGIAFGHDGLGLIVGNRGLVLRSEDGGERWQPIRIVRTAPGKGVSQSP